MKKKKKKKKKMKKKKMQMSAVDLRITAHFTHFGQSRGQNQSVEPQCGGGGSSNGRPYSNPMTKMENHQQCEET
ncbi:unnamed protein product [Staurois parvus]|uniref:Uncharacterized protein n=1 Tax=Staurois parvus TaxID=386267 RepID=A0ABN9FFD6_9NEOB|nr:unnamed protein product [Staurois parvus]